MFSDPASRPALTRPVGRRGKHQPETAQVLAILLTAPTLILFHLTVCYPLVSDAVPVPREQSGRVLAEGIRGSSEGALVSNVASVGANEGRTVSVENHDSDPDGISSGGEVGPAIYPPPHVMPLKIIEDTSSERQEVLGQKKRDLIATFLIFPGTGWEFFSETDPLDPSSSAGYLQAALADSHIREIPVDRDEDPIVSLASHAHTEQIAPNTAASAAAPHAAPAPSVAPSPGEMLRPSPAMGFAPAPGPAEEEGQPWEADWFVDYYPAVFREALLGVLPANVTTEHEPDPQPQLLTLPFYPNYTNILRNFSGTLLGPVKNGVSNEADLAPVYLEDVLGALLNEAQHRASARGGPQQPGTPTQSRSILGAARKGSADEVMYDIVGVTPGAIYSMSMDAAASGVATAGVAFYDSMWRPLEAPSFTVAGRKIQTYAISVAAPKDAQLALVFAGSLPSRAVPDSKAAVVGIRAASFGPANAGSVKVDFRAPVRTVPVNAVGLNTNYMLDGPVRLSAGPGLANTLKDIGMRSLRYPGGEKADGMFWNGRPGGFSPDPQPSRRASTDWPFGDTTLFNAKNSSWVEQPMGFDEYLDLADQLGADPYVVLNYDSANKRDGDKSATLEELKKSAAQWVRYALQQSKRVKFWEFSNESYFKAYNGFATASQYASELVSWAKTLRQIDPDMMLGANGPSNRNGVSEVDSFGQRWWPMVLQTAGSSIDFVICHSYPVTGWTYEFYQKNTLNFQNDVQEVDGAIQTWASAADKQRLRIAVTEFGVLDWAGVWQNSRADLGHALVAFDMLASMLSHPRVDSALFWNTRWKAGNGGGPSMPGSTVYTVYDDNTPTALGAVIKVYANFFPGSTILTTASTQTVRTWAMLPGPGSAWSLTVVLLNKASSPTEQVVEVINYAGNIVGRAGQFGGTADTDISPQWTLLTQGPIILNGSFKITLAPFSITVVTF